MKALLPTLVIEIWGTWLESRTVDNQLGNQLDKSVIEQHKGTEKSLEQKRGTTDIV